MTDGNQSVTEHPTSSRSGSLASHLPLDTDAPGRTFRRRRLAVLTVALLAVLGAVAALAPSGGAEEVEVASGVADGSGFTAQSAGSPVTLSAIVTETTSTLLEADTTTTTEPTPTTSTSVAPTTTESAPTTTVAPTTAAPTTSPPTTAAPTTAAPTTAAPTTSPPTTAAPTTAAPTTQAPASTRSESGGAGYDPNGQQVWLDLAECEANGDWSANTGNGYYGGLQFNIDSWRGVGGSGYPHEASQATQIEMGRRLQAAHGWGAWPHCSSVLGLR